MIDNRIPQVRKIVTSILSKTEFPYCNILVTESNMLIMVVKDTVIYATELTNVQPGFPICFNYGDIENLEVDEYIQDDRLFGMLSSIWFNYSTIENKENLEAVEYNLRNNPEFEKLLELKSTDGMKYFKMYGNIIGDVYFVPIFSKFPNLNKSDNIDIFIYANNGYFVNVLNIFKKKLNRNIKMYFKTINLNQRSMY